MAMIYVLQCEGLPSADELAKHVKLDSGAKAELWRGMGDRAKESIAGILLLQKILMWNHLWNESQVCRLLQSPTGRPFLEGMSADFNISHTEGTVVCALEQEGLSPRVGVDVEKRRGRLTDQMYRVAERWFTAGEQEQLRCGETEETFLRIWTGKEALVKYTGEGLPGLRRADTSRIPRERTLHLSSYVLPDAILSVCGNTVPASNRLHFLTSAELIYQV